jgi:hypothetical protein
LEEPDLSDQALFPEIKTKNDMQNYLPGDYTVGRHLTARLIRSAVRTQLHARMIGKYVVIPPFFVVSPKSL